jgi:serine/threonine protein kinase
MEQQIGRYQIKNEIGRGGMAIVYLAYDPLMARHVSLKLLPHRLTDSATFKKRFQLEAQFIAGLEHPAIVPVYDFGEHEGHLFLVMRHMTGGTLRRQMNHALSIKDVAAIINRLAPALDKAHEQNIIHRDVKPDNVLFDDGGLPYLADFGIARLMESSKNVTIIGTPAYMSPEQVKGDKALNGRSDI